MQNDLKRLANFGFTDAGSAIIDAVWFSRCNTSLATTIGIVLIHDNYEFKAYIGALNYPVEEAHDARFIASNGGKVSGRVAAATFDNRGITKENYGGAW